MFAFSTSTCRTRKLLGSLVAEAGWSANDVGSEEGGVVLPVEWVVDIADKDNDWFVATAYGYKDVEQVVHVMVPDRNAPTWTGDVALNALVRDKLRPRLKRLSGCLVLVQRTGCTGLVL